MQYQALAFADRIPLLFHLRGKSTNVRFFLPDASHNPAGPGAQGLPDFGGPAEVSQWPQEASQQQF